MNKKLLLLAIGSLFLLSGCSLLTTIIGGDGGSIKKDAVIYVRVPGIGTALQESYLYAQDDTYYRGWRLELIDFNLGLQNFEDLEIIPLTVGNEWVYQLTLYDSAGVITYSAADTSFVDRDTTIGNETWYILKAFGEIAAVATNRTDGYWTREVELLDANTILSLGTPYLSARYPANVGDSYESKPGYKTEVLSINKEISITAGNFNGYEYRRTLK